MAYDTPRKKAVVLEVLAMGIEAGVYNIAENSAQQDEVRAGIAAVLREAADLIDKS